MIDTTPFEALQDAVTRAGSQAALARICEVSTTAVWKWLQSSKRMPAEYVLKTESAVGISRHDLRPDIYPREIMTDQRASQRFAGVDHCADIGFPHAPHSSRIRASVDFNRGSELKAAR